MRVSRRVSLAGFVLLCICFFLPQVRGCGEDVVPFIAVVSPDDGGPLMNTNYHGPEFLVLWGLPFIFAFAGIVFFVLRWQLKSSRAARRVTGAACIFSALILVHASWLRAMTSGVPTELGIEELLRLAAACVLLAMCVASLLLLRRRWSAVRMPLCFLFGALASLVYFIYWVRAGPLFGLWFSMLACILIIVGSVLEVLRVREVVAAPT